MSVMGAPGDTNFGINITPIMGANGQIEGIHIGPPAVGAMSFAELRKAAAESAAESAREMRDKAAASARAAASGVARGASAAGRFAATKANAVADRAEVTACKRASPAGFDEVAVSRGYEKHS
jgi:hypothetical protein